MPFNGSGVFQRVRNWVADATAGIKIRADYHDSEDDGFAAGLSNCITKDGQTIVTENIPFNSKRITGLADPVNPQDAMTKAASDSSPLYVKKAGDYMGGNLVTAPSTAAINSAGGTGTIEVRGSGGTDASMSFHRPGIIATNFGLGGDGNFYMGGWSHGAVVHRFWTTRDFNYAPVNKGGDTVTGTLNAHELQAGRLVATTGVGGGSGHIESYANNGDWHMRLHNNSYGSKYFRVVAGAQLEFINSGFNAVIATLSDAGNFSANGSLYAPTVYAGTSFRVGSTTLGTTSLELGSQGGADNAFIDFHTGGVYDFNTRLIVAPSSNVLQIETGKLQINASIQATGLYGRDGATGGIQGNSLCQGWFSPWIIGFVDGIQKPTWSSDYRIKKNVIDLPGMWDTVKNLRPIQYSLKDFSPPAHLDHIEKMKKNREADKDVQVPGLLFTDDDTERWGFIAHELQETLTPSAVMGDKDAPNAIQGIDPMTVVTALTKALQEAMARIEALESRGA